MYQSGKMKGEGKGLKKKNKNLGFWNMNRLEIVTESSAQRMTPAPEMNVCPVVLVEENYVW